MEIERTKDSIILKLPSDVDTLDLQRMIDYLTYKEVTIGSRVNQKEVDKLANESKADWWKSNRHRFVK